MLLAVYLGLRYLVPWFTRLIGASQNAAPVPRFAVGLYLTCAAVGALVYLSSDERRWRLFLGPIVRLFAFPPGRPRRHQTLALGLIPLIAGVVAWNLTPRLEPPTALRLQHPTMPQRYAALENPYRKVSDAERRKAEEEGIVLYQKNCRPCHGTEADGSGPLARGLRLRPVDFRDPGTIATVVEPYVFWRIKEGALGLPPIAAPWESAMPAWSELSDDEIWKTVLATYAIAGKEPRKPEGVER
jgi:mono/diheme cytochrome c family protein